jgi:hypothetical protein
MQSLFETKGEDEIVSACGTKQFLWGRAAASSMHESDMNGIPVRKSFNEESMVSIGKLSDTYVTLFSFFWWPCAQSRPQIRRFWYTALHEIYQMESPREIWANSKQLFPSPGVRGYPLFKYLFRRVELVNHEQQIA